MQKPYLEVGEVVAVHGVQGACRVYPWCDSAAVFGHFSTLYWDAEGRRGIRVLRAGQTRGLAVLQLEGIETVEQARTLVGKVLYAKREDIPLAPGSHFIQDLLGAQVTDADTGVVYGVIRDVTHPANCDIYEIETPAGGTVLFPAVEAFIVSADVDAGVVQVRPIEGMFEA